MVLPLPWSVAVTSMVYWVLAVHLALVFRLISPALFMLNSAASLPPAMA